MHHDGEPAMLCDGQGGNSPKTYWGHPRLNTPRLPARHSQVCSADFLLPNAKVPRTYIASCKCTGQDWFSCAATLSLAASELLLRNARGHDAGGGQAAAHDVAHLVHDLRSAPLLVGQGLYLVLALLSLDHLHVCRRTVLGVLLGKEINAEGIAVEAGQGDELPAKAELGKVPNEGLHLRISHAGTVPVEGRAQVVSQHLVRNCCAHLLCKLRGLCQNGLAGLHPNAVSIGGESDRTLDAELSGALNAEVAFHGARGIPVKEDIAAHVCGCLAHLVNGHLARILEPLGWVLALGLQCLGNGIRESHATRALLPILVRALPHCFVQRLHTLDGGTLDVRVVDGILGLPQRKPCG